jgi:hypothetical protein
LEIGLKIVGMRHSCRADLLELLFRVAEERFDGGSDRYDLTFERSKEHPDAGDVEQGVPPFVALAQGGSHALEIDLITGQSIARERADRFAPE